MKMGCWTRQRIKFEEIDSENINTLETRLTVWDGGTRATVSIRVFQQAAALELSSKVHRDS